MYIEKKHLYKNKCLYQDTLNHAKLNRIISKKYDVQEMLVLLRKCQNQHKVKLYKCI